jgi:hypothetical protein
LTFFGERNGVFFSKTNDMIKFLHNLAFSGVKNAIFCNFFSANIFKNHNVGPGKFVTLKVWHKFFALPSSNDSS